MIPGEKCIAAIFPGNTFRQVVSAMSGFSPEFAAAACLIIIHPTSPTKATNTHTESHHRDDTVIDVLFFALSFSFWSLFLFISQIDVVHIQKRVFIQSLYTSSK